jgi:glucokinase
MVLAIDVGATKVLMAIFNSHGEIEYKQKFPTSPAYQQFLKDFKETYEAGFNKYEIRDCCCAIPGSVDRRRGVGKNFGNLKWHNVPIQQDLKKILGGIPVKIENDAKLAGLSEANLIHKEYKNILYITIGTGIGDAIITNGIIDPYLADSEAGQMIVQYQGKMIRWEDIASGRALKLRFGKMASEIEDPQAWKQFAEAFALGLRDLIAVLTPQAVIIGGGVGTHFEKFDKLLKEELGRFKNDLVKIPPLLKAKRPEEAVIYGCYDFVHQG